MDNRAFRFSVPSTLLCLAVVPACLFVVVHAMYMANAPVWAGTVDDYENGYVYLLNGMGLIHGYVPGHIDHPGTPVQVIAGAIAYVTWLLRSAFANAATNFDAAVLSEPEFYIEIVSLFFLLINSCAILYLGLRVYRATKLISLAILVQSAFGLFGITLFRMADVASEALLIFSATMLMAALSDVLLAPDNRGRDSSKSLPVVVGFLLALGLTAKVPFAPLILAILFLPTTKEKLLAAATLIVCTAALLFPIWPRLPRFFQWLAALTMHSQRYGAGPRDVMEFAAVPGRLALLIRYDTLIFVAFGACAIVALVRWLQSKRTPHALDSRLPRQGALFCVILFFQVLICIKHFALHYVIPSLALAPMALGWAVLHGLSRLQPDLRALLRSSALALVLLFAANDISTSMKVLDFAGRARDADIALLRQTIDAHPNALLIGCYRARDPEFAIQFGIGYTSDDYAAELGTIRGDAFSYNRFNDRLYHYGDWLELSYLNELISQGREVLMILPNDIDLPKVRAELLVKTPNRERIVKVLHVDE